MLCVSTVLLYRGSVVAGAPNITFSGGFSGARLANCSGALYETGTNTAPAGNHTQDYKGHTFVFDASRSSSIYGSSTTITPESLSTQFFIKYL